MWQHQTGFEDQYREMVVSSLNTLVEKLGHDSSYESMVALSAVGFLSNQDAGLYRKLADFYYAKQNWIGAIVNFNKCCMLNETDFNSMFYLASSYRNIGLFDEAIDVYSKSLQIHQYPEAMLNMALTYSEISQSESQIKTLENLTATFPEFTLGHYNSGIYWYGKRNLKKSIQCYRRALESNADHGESKIALSLALLMDKQYIEGFLMNESRWGVLPNCPIRQFSRPSWGGQNVPNGSSLLVTVEQGFGDTLQMLRYLPLLLEKFNKIYIEVQPQMQRLVSLSYPQVDVVVNGHELPRTDFYCPIMSLPRSFDTSYDTIPVQTPYIDIPLSEPLNLVLSNNLRGKIGVCWRGGMLDPRMVHRSLSLKSIKNLFDVDDYVWVSLVKDLPDDERADLVTTSVVDITSELTDFYDTYRLISALDVVITVDTAVAHLAGAMGKPTIVILNEGYDWRWHVDDDISAWYPGTQLLRAYKLDTPDALVPDLLARVKKILD